MRKIAIVGAGGHAKVVIDIVEKQGQCSIVGLIDKFNEVGENTLGYQNIGTEDNILALQIKFGFDAVIIAIGDNFRRQDIVQRLRTIGPNLEYISAIHPSAIIGKGCVLGEGCVLMAGSVVNPGCHVGEHCILNTLSSMDHDSQLENFVSLAPHAALGGGVLVGTCSAICIGASLKHDVCIGQHTVIGAGAMVVENIGDRCVAYGVPAQEVRSRKPGELYL